MPRKKNAAVNEEVKSEVEVMEEKKTQKRGGRKKTAAIEELPATKAEIKDVEEEKTEPVRRGRRKKTEIEEAEKKEPVVRRRRRKKTEIEAEEQESKAEEKTSNKMEIITVVQYKGHQIEQKEMIAKVEEAWRAEGNTVPIKEIEMYIKPEDGKIYYVVNGLAGSCDLF